MGHRQGENRQQSTLFPVMLDELVPEDSLVRVIDAWVSGLDMKVLGFAKAHPQVMGAPAYDPADLLKLYIWGYLNAARSSRGLERECHRDVECMWLLRRLAPDHKTISDFRARNTAALVQACAAFVQFARAQRLIASKTVAVDGTKVRAVASRKAITGKQRLAEEARRNAAEIAEYLKMLDTRDGQEAGTQPPAGDVRRALERLEREREAIQAEMQRVNQHQGRILVTTEPEAQVMESLHKAPGYNLQTAVEVESHLIVVHAVTNEAGDQRLLLPMAEAASEVLQAPCTVVADAGYSNGEQIAQLEAQGVVTFVAPRRGTNSHGEGQLYDRSAFIYDARSNSLTCPAGKTLKQKQLHRRDKLVIYAARAKDCSECPHKHQCTNSSRRVVARHLYEEALEATARRLRQHPQMLQIRKQTVEHPFDFIKHRALGNARLLLRGLRGATAELSLAVLAYNLKRVFNMKGGIWMRQAMQG